MAFFTLVSVANHLSAGASYGVQRDRNFWAPIQPTGHPFSAEIKKAWSQTPTAPICIHGLDEGNCTYINLKSFPLTGPVWPRGWVEV